MDKTLSLLKERIGNEEYYEAHQSIRTVVTRLLRKRSYNEAIELLYSSCLILADAKQFGSTIDLLAYLIEVYTKASTICDGESKGRIAQILAHFDPADHSIKQVERAIEVWIQKVSQNAVNGDPDLHHVFGLVYFNGGHAYDAERHLLLGTKDSAKLLADLHSQWYATDKDTAALYMSRGVLPYLCLKKFVNLEVYLQAILAKIQSDIGGTVEQSILRVDGQPMVAYLQLLVQCCLKQNIRIYSEVTSHYDPKQFDAWQPALTYIEAEYFNIRPKPKIDLANLMGSMFNR